MFIRFGWLYIDRTGKISDQVLIAILIQVEFGKESDPFFGEALEGLSRQYFSERVGPTITCFGSCTLSAQLAWLTNMHGFRKNDFNGWENQMESASKAMDPSYRYGEKRDTWFWGNVDEAKLGSFDIVLKRSYWDERSKKILYFIIHR